MSERVTVKLETPLELGGEVVSELSFRAPLAKDMKGIVITVSEGGLKFDLGMILELASKISGVPPMLLGQATMGDVVRIVEAVVPLLPGFLTAGAAGSQS